MRYIEFAKWDTDISWYTMYCVCIEERICILCAATSVSELGEFENYSFTEHHITL